MTHPLAPLAGALAARAVRYVLIGVSGANLYGPGGQAIFATEDFDLFVPPDSVNLVHAWEAAEAIGWDLASGREPLDRPRDRWLADRVIERRTLTTAQGPDALVIEFTLVMAGFDFETVWAERREFRMEGIAVPVARLLHIITSKHAAGRDKDRLFLATHKDALEQLLRKADPTG